MTETASPETVISTGPSKKRQYTATATAVVLNVVLTVAAAKLIDQFTGKVKTAICPEQTNSN